MKEYTLGVIGAGNMATAIINGIVSKNVLLNNEIIVSDVDENKLMEIQKLGVSTTIDNVFLLNKCSYVLIAVKPQVAKQILSSLDFSSNIGVISIMAGIKIKSIIKMTKCEVIARIMPNLPAFVGEAMSAICFTENKTDAFYKLVLDVFSSIGKAILLPESAFDSVVSVSGSGPAYVFYFINSMIKSGMVQGFSYEQAKALTLQTFFGSVKMVESSTKPIDELIQSVCSKGGTTIEAVKCFDENKLSDIINDGMLRCKKRSEELSEEG